MVDEDGAERPEQKGPWTVLAKAGDPTCTKPEDGDAEIPARDDLALVLQGRELAAEERRRYAPEPDLCHPTLASGTASVVAK